MPDYTHVHLDTLYGSSKPINIDTIDNNFGYIYRCITGSNFRGASPSSLLGNSNGFLLIGFSAIDAANQLPFYGVQIAIGFGNAKMAIRYSAYSLSGSAWSSWATV